MAARSAPGPVFYRVPTEVLSRQVKDEMVLLNVESEEYFGLNEVGSRMWHLLQESGDGEKVVAQLLEDYDVEESVLRRDLAELVERLQKAGLLEEVAPPIDGEDGHQD